MKKTKNIYLIGPMGSGKTSIGKELAKKLALTFIDVDDYVEQKTGVNIPWIFDVEGEAGFRMREADAIIDLTSRQGILLSTGGGVVVTEKNRRLLGARGVVIFLVTSPQQQYERICQNNTRPLVATENPLHTLQTLFDKRKAWYDEIADVSFETDGKSVSQMADSIMDYLDGEY